MVTHTSLQGRGTRGEHAGAILNDNANESGSPPSGEMGTFTPHSTNHCFELET